MVSYNNKFYVTKLKYMLYRLHLGTCHLDSNHAMRFVYFSFDAFTTSVSKNVVKRGPSGPTVILG